MCAPPFAHFAFNISQRISLGLLEPLYFCGELPGSAQEFVSLEWLIGCPQRDTKPSCLETWQTHLQFMLYSFFWNLAEPGISPDNASFLSSPPSPFCTPLTVSPGSTVLINHLHLNPWLRFSFWDDLTEDMKCTWGTFLEPEAWWDGHYKSLYLARVEIAQVVNTAWSLVGSQVLCCQPGASPEGENVRSTHRLFAFLSNCYWKSSLEE